MVAIKYEKEIIMLNIKFHSKIPWLLNAYMCVTIQISESSILKIQLILHYENSVKMLNKIWSIILQSGNTFCIIEIICYYLKTERPLNNLYKRQWATCHPYRELNKTISW